MAARTAVVAGTATAVSGGVARRQQQRQADQQELDAYERQRQQAQTVAAVQAAQPAPAPPAAADDPVTQLERLAALQKQGVLTDEEFAAQKARILQG